MKTTVRFAARRPSTSQLDVLAVVGRRDRLLSDEVVSILPEGVGLDAWRAMVTSGEARDAGRVLGTWTEGNPTRVVACVLPEACSRHNTPSRSWAISSMLGALRRKGKHAVWLAVDDEHLFACAMAASATMHTYKARHGKESCAVTIAKAQGNTSPKLAKRIQASIEARRLAADWVDRPPNVLGCDAFVREAKAVAKRTGASVRVIRGPDLLKAGMGGIHGVGRTAQQAPALVVLDHEPTKPTAHHAWVGKGIVYDTGGLSLKTKTGMPGMKCDMGGAAAVLAAFEAAATLDATTAITAVLCIAENAIGPDALKPDDVIHMLSGRAVEVNNTDAEGRLVLGDGVAWAAKERKPDVVIDLATLTGAQAMATGKRHAGIVCNDDALEAQAIRAGKETGDLVHPLPYCPEFFRKEFRSQVADMKNSVKDRSNAQSSCAGQFIKNHLDAVAYEGPWLHVDLAGPAFIDGRGTGFGVGLLLALAGVV